MFKYLKCTYQFEYVSTTPSSILYKHTCLYYTNYTKVKKWSTQQKNTNCLRFHYEYIIKKKRQNHFKFIHTSNTILHKLLTNIYSVYYSVDSNAIRLNEYELRYIFKMFLVNVLWLLVHRYNNQIQSRCIPTAIHFH